MSTSNVWQGDEQQFRRLADSAPALMWVANTDGQLIFLNQAWLEFSGKSEEEELGTGWTERIYKDDLALYQSTIDNLYRSHDPFEITFRLRRADQEYRWVLNCGRPLFSEEGIFTGFIGVCTDITDHKKEKDKLELILSERKQHEEALRDSEEQLRQSQKMQAVGRLAGGIAHDFNNLLTSILGFSRLIMDSVKTTDPVHADAEEICRAGERAAKLTKQLLTFSRKQMLKVIPLDLNHVVTEMHQLLRRTVGEDIELVTLLGENLKNIEADVGLLEQVIMNLAVNARDAMPTGGKLTIQTSSQELDEKYCKNFEDLKPGPYVLLSIRDTGAGMTQEVREHAFEPFFTTKAAGKGTGLGLSTVYGIVKQGLGHIELDSVAGHGTEFKIYTPTTNRSTNNLTQKEAALPQGTETMLLVEDEDTVRKLTARVLSSLGYHILQARNGSEALLVCEEYEQTIDIVLTDVVMPHMGGDELAQHLREIRPDLKVIFTSGFTDHAVIEQGFGNGEVNLIHKPYTTKTLAKTIRDALDA